MFEGKSRSLGITRSRLNDLLHKKGKGKTPRKRFSKKALRKAMEDDDYGKSSLLSTETRPSEIEMASFDEPSWMEEYRQCCQLIQEVETLQGQIAKEKAKKLTSIDEKKHDRIIQSFLDQASTKLAQCERKLKGMEKINEFQQDGHNRKIFANMMMAIAMNIRQKARELRLSQQGQLQRDRQLRSLTKSVFDDDNATGTMSDHSLDEWYYQESTKEVQQKILQQRNEQINKIVKSIHSLNTIYKQLNNLVIQQGSLLDRIDENVQITYQNTKKANQNLKQAAEHQENGCFRKVRCAIIGLIMLLFLIVILKNM